MNTIEISQKTSRRGTKTLLTLMIIVLILAVSSAAAFFMIKTSPKAERKARTTEAPLVTVMTPTRGSQQITITATGTVMPAEEVSLKSEVKGRVIAVKKSFELGSHVAFKEELLQLEPTDYQLAVAQAENEVAQAAYDLALEQGYQDIAREEWKLYNNKDNASQSDKDLALRKPHLMKAQAAYKAAQAELAQAKIDLQRTIMTAPFNALVTTKEVEPGSYLAVQGDVATLVNSDRFWIQVSVPVDRLHWIRIPTDNSEEGSEVTITVGNRSKSGRIHRLLADLSDNGRMARLLVEIKDPLDLKKVAKEREPLLLGEYVRVEIAGKTVDNVVSVPRNSVHDGDKIWLYNEQGQLEISNADILWRTSDQVLLSNPFPEGASLITSNLAAPVSGMQLRSAAKKNLAMTHAEVEASHD